MLSAVAAALLLAAAPPAVPAPAPASALSTFNGVDFRPELGKWAEYEVRKKGEAVRTMRVAIVGKETEPVLAWWLEMSIKGPDREFILKMLTTDHPGSPGAMRRMIVQIAPGMVLETPVLPDESTRKPSPVPEPLGSELVKTPAGTFKAVKQRTQGGVSYLSKEVAVFGLVKASGPEGVTELIRQGDGASSLVQSTPQQTGIPVVPGAWRPKSSGGP